jgi:5'-nucleotidase (lipoprotein e(P4) family)
MVKHHRMKKIFVAIAIVVVGCSTQKNIATEQPAQHNLITDGKLFTSLFQQRAAEYKALCYQAYNIAHDRVDIIVEQQHTKPLAIVTDIDETVLDNSPYAVHQALLGKGYDLNSWIEWTDKATADTVPGACSFFKYAASKNIEIFYVTNRSEKERASTLQNLQKYNFPNANDTHLFLMKDSSSKETRRQNILATHEIVLLLGDNLADLSAAFDDKKYDSRLQNVQALSAQFGQRFIVLPNANYGDWESAVYNSKMSDAQKDSAVKAVLKSY